MKFFSLLVCTFFCNILFAQKQETYYDYQWKQCDPLVARFYSIKEKTDSGWLRKDYYLGGLKLQMKALFSDSACEVHNGYMYFFYPNGTPSIIGRKLANKNEGLCLSYHYNGMMMDSAFFSNGNQIGNRIKWHPNGFPSDSIAPVNDSMQVHISWFDNGNPSTAGYLKNGNKHGKWQYFHINGNLASLEVYGNNKVVSGEYYDEAGAQRFNTLFSMVEVSPEFKGGMEGWKKYLEKNLYWPNGLQFANGNMAIVTVNLTVNEDGKVENAYVSTPFHPEFDKIALRVINQSPKWQPAMQNTRRIKYRFTQNVTFQQPDE